jgi:hypothetical protein
MSRKRAICTARTLDRSNAESGTFLSIVGTALPAGLGITVLDLPREEFTTLLITRKAR